MKHRLTWVVAAAAAALLAAGCSNPAADKDDSSGSTTPGGQVSDLPPNCSTSKPTIGVSLPNTVNPYYIAMRSSFLSAGKTAGFKVNMAIATDSDSNQLSQVQTFIQQGVCAVALNAVNSSPGAAVVKALNQAHIPVFTVNVTVDPNDLKRQHASYVQYVGADQVEGGRAMGEAVLKDFGQNAKLVIGIGGDPDQIPTNQRDAGFKKALSVDPNAKFASTVNTKVDPNVALQVTSDMLQGNPKMNVIFADTGPAAVGALQAIKQQGRQGKVALYAFCAANQQLDATLYRGCAAQEPAKYAQIVVDNISTYVKHKKSVKHTILVPVKEFSEGQKPGPGEVG